MRFPPGEDDPRVYVPPPCDGCRHAARCQAERLACESFALYMNCASAARVHQAPREPSRAIYLATLSRAPPRKRGPGRPPTPLPGRKRGRPRKVLDAHA
jgi:hypothetical protein